MSYCYSKTIPPSPAIFSVGTITISNMLGKTVLRKNCGAASEVNIESVDWPAGGYLVMCEVQR